MTKKLFYFVIAAALICGASVFTSCTNDDNPIAEPDLGVADKIIGKWMMADQDGQAMPTNEKIFYICLRYQSLQECITQRSSGIGYTMV